MAHPLGDEAIGHIEKSWGMVQEFGLQEAGIVMFKRLFEVSPDLQNLFPFAGDTLTDDHEGMKEHSYIVMTSLDECLKIVHDVPKLKDELIALGAVHHIHGVTSDHFAPVGNALIWTLEAALKDKFTPEVKAAWLSLYKVVQSLMEQGMEEGITA